jgi:hypothetical protein
MRNGKLTPKELAPIYHPKLGLFLASREAAASWNTMRLFLLQRYGSHGEIYPEGPLGAYRDYAGQVHCRQLYGNNAAVPGTSNHGLGHAVDVADHFMAGMVDKHGGLFGWHHWDAKWEWWHREYDGGFDRPDPGPDQRYPVLRKGSGGVGQASYILRSAAAAECARPPRGRRRRLRHRHEQGRAFLPAIATPRRRRRARPQDMARARASDAPAAEAKTEADASPEAAAWLRRVGRSGRHRLRQVARLRICVCDRPGRGR